MNITRNNYEEFFILYLDNELCSDDRSEVESFVRENPDLKNEFDLLLQTRMTPDHDLMFDGKQQLLKTASPAPISETNFEEWLLLYIDNELTPKEKIAVEEFVTQNSSAENALKQLQKTKLHPEHAVVFPNKEILYRREKRTPLVAIRVWRIAVAAALLLGYLLLHSLCSMTTIKRMKDKSLLKKCLVQIQLKMILRTNGQAKQVRLVLR